MSLLVHFAAQYKFLIIIINARTQITQSQQEYYSRQSIYYVNLAIFLFYFLIQTKTYIYNYLFQEASVYLCLLSSQVLNTAAVAMPSNCFSSLHRLQLFNKKQFAQDVSRIPHN